MLILLTKDYTNFHGESFEKGKGTNLKMVFFQCANLLHISSKTYSSNFVVAPHFYTAGGWQLGPLDLYQKYFFQLPIEKKSTLY